MTRTYVYQSYDTIIENIKSWEIKYPDLIKAWTAEEKYGLPSGGECGSKECEHHFFCLTNHKTLPDPRRPQVFFSGELHGDERVGPTAMMEFAQYLLENYGKNAWITRLLDTRKIYIMPTPNAIGYYQSKREENKVDPNRDFPVDNPSSCMETIAARALNELFREQMFQLALTFHGGMQAIAFEWGTVSRIHNDISPDDVSQLALGSVMSAYAGAFNTEGLYSHDRLSDIVYPVRGGMEDWAYASSWDKTKPCNPSSYGGYPSEKTTYSENQLRAINILIETSTPKIPVENTLGSTEELLRPVKGKGDGHIPRNVRLAMFITDIVEPYVQWYNYTERDFWWEVGGAFHVTDTALTYSFSASEKVTGTKLESTEHMHGRTRWSGGGMSVTNEEANMLVLQGKDIDLNTGDHIDDREIWPYIPQFHASIPKAPEWATHVSVTACATVDQEFGVKPNYKVYPDLPPQSHFANARTNPSWFYKNGESEVAGKVNWCSETVVIPLESGLVYMYQTGNRYHNEVPNPEKENHHDHHHHSYLTKEHLRSAAPYFMIFIAFLGLIGALRLYWKSRKYEHYERVDRIEDIEMA